MKDWIEKVDRIEEKISKLLHIQSQLEADNRKLKTEVEEKRLKITELKENYGALVEENRSLKAANTLLGSNDFKRETKLKINSLVKEIDLCIAQLSR